MGEIKVDERAFRRKHGKPPEGDRLWTFRYVGLRLWFTKRGGYAECLAAAVESARSRGVSTISVSSVTY